MPDRERHIGPRRVFDPFHVLCAALLTGAGALSVAAWARGANEPSPPVARDIAAAAPGHVVDAAPVVALPSESVRTEAGHETGAIHGAVHDAAGEPIAGWSIQLRRPRARKDGLRDFFDDRSLRFTTTDDGGAFHFEGLPAGTYHVRSTADDQLVVVELGAGEQRAVDLRVDGEGAAVLIHVTRAGAPAANMRFCVVGDGEGDRYGMTGEDGQCLRFLPFGTWRVQVFGESDVRQRRGEIRRDLVLCEHEIVVPPGGKRLRCDIELPVTILELVVVGASPPAEVEFRVDGRSDAGAEDLRFEVSAKDGRAAVEVPAGRWTVAARGPGLVESSPQEVATAAGVPRVRVEVPVQPAVDVILDLRRPDGRPFVLPVHSAAMVALLPELVSGSLRRGCGPIGEAKGVLGGAAPLGYVGVPFGTATVHAQDRMQNDGLVYLPFDPVEPQVIDVGGPSSRIVAVVQPRAFVELVGCARTGMQDIRARIRVFAGDTLVRPVCSPEQSRWQAFLPPGEYRVVVDRESGATENRLFVQRDAITLRLRP